ncbi:MAG: DUF2142 domain-containing protein [Actinobacteria bacterium]|uniref:Unannotated protein n=1 Tax=freshwater metagenome TaxID=449393 RepID=A0A6J5YHH1_9ZZZZ|nr:DUF2142 domain-containing protein [Actinomycetota bacterium]
MHSRFRPLLSKVLRPKTITFLFVAALGFLVVTPINGGADEPMHQATAWYYVTHGTPPSTLGVEVFDIPKALTVNPCFQLQAKMVDASCMPTRPELSGISNQGFVINYPPFYYYVVGAGQVLVHAIKPGFEDEGGRLASLMLNFCVMGWLFRRVSQKYRSSQSYLMILATPIVVFYWAVVNPTGWEITCALWFTFELTQVFGRADSTQKVSDSRDHHPDKQLLLLGLAGLALSSARPVGFIWMALLTSVAFMLNYGALNKNHLQKIAVALSPGAIFGVVWNYLNPVRLTWERSVTEGLVVNPDVGDYIRWTVTALEQTPAYVYQIFGILGWLDAPNSALLVLVLTVSWAWYLRATHMSAAVPNKAWFAIFVSVFVVPTILQVGRWNSFPHWWQGRYTLPVIVGIILMLMLRSDNSRIPRFELKWLANLSAVSLAWMVLQVIFRYSFGVYEQLPLRTTDPGIGIYRFSFGLIIVVLLSLWTLTLWNERDCEVEELQSNGQTVTHNAKWN